MKIGAFAGRISPFPTLTYKSMRFVHRLNFTVLSMLASVLSIYGAKKRGDNE
jgi:hypothetical protein